MLRERLDISRHRKSCGGKTHSLTSKLAHDGLKRLLVLLQQYVQLLVLVLQLLVFNYKSCVHAFHLALEDLYTMKPRD